MSQEAWIIDAVRAPRGIGKQGKGSLAAVASSCERAVGGLWSSVDLWGSADFGSGWYPGGDLLENEEPYRY